MIRRIASVLLCAHFVFADSATETFETTQVFIVLTALFFVLAVAVVVTAIQLWLQKDQF